MIRITYVAMATAVHMKIYITFKTGYLISNAFVNTGWAYVGYLCSLYKCIHIIARSFFVNISRLTFVAIRSLPSDLGSNARISIIYFYFYAKKKCHTFLERTFIAFKMAPNITLLSLYFSNYGRLYKCLSWILKFF